MAEYPLQILFSPQREATSPELLSVEPQQGMKNGFPLGNKKATGVNQWLWWSAGKPQLFCVRTLQTSQPAMVGVPGLS